MTDQQTFIPQEWGGDPAVRPIVQAIISQLLQLVELNQLESSKGFLAQYGIGHSIRSRKLNGTWCISLEEDDGYEITTIISMSFRQNDQGVFLPVEVEPVSIIYDYDWAINTHTLLIDLIQQLECARDAANEQHELEASLETAGEALHHDLSNRKGRLPRSTQKARIRDVAHNYC